MVPSCILPAGSTSGKENSGNPVSLEVDFSGSGTPTAVVTPTPPTEIGKGEIFFGRILSMEDAAGGITGSNVSGTIPVTISFNKTRNVWEVKGSNLGAGSTEYHATKPSKIDCTAVYTVDITLSGVLVPLGGLIEDKGAGCYTQLYTTEDWERTDATCSTHLGNASDMFDETIMNTYGPTKINLVAGGEANEIKDLSGALLHTHWKIETLTLPLSTGCMAGEVILQSK